MAGSSAATILSEENLLDVYSEVIEIAAQWKDFGLALGAKNSQLEVLARANPFTPKECLREVLSEWLQGRYSKPRTWEALCKAVGQPAGGNSPLLAEAIAHKYGLSITFSVAPAPEPTDTAKYLDQVVTVRDLLCIKYKKPGDEEVQYCRIERTLSTKWDSLAQQLDISHEECKAILMEKLNDQPRCLQEAVSRWIQRKGQKHTTWKKFLEVLRDAGLKNDADTLEEALQYRIGQ